jgi:2-amino-4-hydroxy-6-hydroxymethyldihydropteridine diphosphokinase
MSGHFVIGLGSNLGSRYALLGAAVDLLRATPDVVVHRASSVYETDAIGPPQPRYLNGAVLVETAGPPQALLAIAHRIEAQLGRIRGERWAARTIDLDLLWAEQGDLSSGDLIVPHPRLTERAFALAPLLEVAPYLGSVYGRVLQKLGGAPPIRGRIDAEPACRLSTYRGRYKVETAGNDRAERLARAATAFALATSAVGPSQGPIEVRTVQCTCTPDSEGASFIYSTVKELNSGFYADRAVVTCLERGGISGRLIGRTSDVPGADLTEVQVRETAGKGRVRICWNRE